MADFYQTGMVATLHRLNPDGSVRLESELERLSERVSMGLVLPALYSEFETPAMRRIANELRKVKYLSHIVVALGRATHNQLIHAQSFFEDFPTPVTFLWIDAPPIQRLFDQLEACGISAGNDGKGRSYWLSHGYLLATGNCDVIALHDCDIKNYSKDLLARLCYPVANPDLGFEFCKGYYARVTDRMHGRVTRLFMTPLIRSLMTVAPEANFLRFIDSFRYPLAGEFAMKANLARINRIPGDWGLEVGLLSEVFRNCAASRVCQADITDNYDHKHQVLSAEDATKGLSRMAYEIGKSLFRTMASEGVVLSRDDFRTLEARYVRLAEDTIHRYYADAMLNGLRFDRHCEEEAVAAFARSLRRSADSFQEDPLGAPPLPNWNRVLAAIPDFFERLLDAAAVHNGAPARTPTGMEYPNVASYVA